MKLHLGCGKRYIGGSINVDRYDLAVADLSADARCLPFRDDACSVVVAHQLIEHLGYAGAIYALSEWFRVLEPGGELVIETPEPRGAFERFLVAESPAAKDHALGWIFGDEAPGYTHTFLYPEDLLRGMIERAGFELVELGEPQTYVTEPGLRLTCRTSSDPVSRALAALRARMAGVVLALSDPSEAAELENGFIEHLRSFSTARADALQPHAEIALVIWSRAAAWWIDELEGLDLEASDEVRRWTGTAGEMARFGLSGRLTAMLEPMTFDGPPTRHLHDELTSMGRRVVGQCHETSGSAERCWELVFGEPPPEPAGELFTASRVQHLAELLHASALKSWTLGDIAGAREVLRRVCRIGSGQLYAFWNLGRISANEGELDEAVRFMDEALALASDLEAGALLVDLGMCLHALGAHEEAEAVLDDERVGARPRRNLDVGVSLAFGPVGIGEVPGA